MFVSRNQMHILCIALSSDDNRGITDTRYLMAIHIRVKNVGKEPAPILLYRQVLVCTLHIKQDDAVFVMVPSRDREGIVHLQKYSARKLFGLHITQFLQLGAFTFP